MPAVYFVEPTPANVARIAADLRVGLYEQVYLNWTSSIPRYLMEDLAQQVAQSDSSQGVAKVYDQYLNYECLERNLFSFSMSNTFQALNGPNANEGEIEGLLDRITGSLFSVFLSLGGQCPVICASKGTAAEMIGSKLDKRLKTHLANMQSNVIGESNLGETTSLQRPLLVLLDRNFDLCTPLKHTSTYNALVHDVLGMRLNRINLVTKDGPKSYDVDAADWFWAENARLPFLSVAENVDTALNKYKTDMQQVTRSSGVKSIDDLKADHGATLTAEELKVAINVLPELTERKRLIDCHLQLASALLDQIRDRDLGNLFMMEQQLQDLNKPALLAAIRKQGQGNASDKMRLFLVWYFSQSNEVPPTDLLELEKALHDAGGNMAVFEAAKKIRSYRKMMNTMASSPKEQPVSTNEWMSKITSTTTGVLGNIVSSVKNLLPESTETPLTKQLDLAFELTTGQPAANTMFRPSTSTSQVRPEDVLALFDPRAARNQPTARHNFGHLIVFIVGGSNYSEYNHAEEYVRKKSQQLQFNLHTTFGTTELITGDEFLSQLALL